MSNARGHLVLHRLVGPLELVPRREPVLRDPGRVQRERVPLVLPALLLVLASVVGAVDAPFPNVSEVDEDVYA